MATNAGAPRLQIPPADVIVIGAGVNGLAAAIVAAQAGCSVTVIEANSQVGGSCCSAPLTLQGFTHDICAAVFPLGVASPFFESLPLSKYGLEWIQPEIPLAHPLDNGAIALRRTLEDTASALGADGRGWSKLFGPLVRDWHRFLRDLLAPPHIPSSPVTMARFGWNALRSAASVARSRFRGEYARALLAGLAGHSTLPLSKLGTSAIALVLGAAANVVGWPIAKGGAQSLSNALAEHLRALGGTIVTGCRVEALDQLPPARAVLCDLTPRQLLRLAGERLPPAVRGAFQRYRYGMGVFKMDFALDGPIPWKHELCTRAGTLHLGGTLDEIAASERAAWSGAAAEKPFVLLGQPSVFDPSRAPAGQQAVWAYCHVPHGSAEDMSERVEQQIERFAPGFLKRILARSIMNPRQLEEHNANLVGGDIGGGATLLSQLLMRPTRRMYSVGVSGLYLCSSSTPPGPGAHGMCGYFAAKLGLKEVFGA